MKISLALYMPIKAELARQWRERIERSDAAGTTIAEFYHAEGYSIASFYQWRR